MAGTSPGGLRVGPGLPRSVAGPRCERLQGDQWGPSCRRDLAPGVTAPPPRSPVSHGRHRGPSGSRRGRVGHHLTKQTSAARGQQDVRGGTCGRRTVGFAESTWGRGRRAPSRPSVSAVGMMVTVVIVVTAVAVTIVIVGWDERTSVRSCNFPKDQRGSLMRPSAPR